MAFYSDGPRRSLSQPPPLPLSHRKARPPAKSILDLKELSRFKNILVFAESMVEGFLAGRHRSPFQGSSAEFLEYKEYAPGDEPAHLDWKVYAKTKRLYRRSYVDETDMVVYLMVDKSASMRYQGRGRDAKFALASKIAAALAYLMIKQGDNVALVLFDEKVTQLIPPGGTRFHLSKICNALERIQASDQTGIDRALQECASLFKKRGRMVLLSDFLVPYAPLFEALSRFVHRRFEVMLMQVLDPDERELPYTAYSRFVDLETGEAIKAEPEEIRRDYQRVFKENMLQLQSEAANRTMQYHRIDSAQPYLSALEAYVGFRGKQAKRQSGKLS